ncbi:MAG: winged helix-turn-helix domain-containing protein [Acidiferrobacteraceae bacterium]
MTRAEGKALSIGDWRVSPAEDLLQRGDELVRLEPKAMEVLVYLASRPGDVVTREELERDVWRGAVVGYDAVTNTVIKLRKALQDDARQPRFIATVPKKGYQLIAPVTQPDDDAHPAAVATVAPSPAAGPSSRPSWMTGATGKVLAGLAVILVIGLVALGVVNHSGQAGPPSIVVLPFENISNDTRQDYLADGITEDIITDLSRLSGLMVMSRATSSSFKGRDVAPDVIGKDLGVQYVLKGSVQRQGAKVRVSAQLVDTRTSANAWGQRFDRDASQVFSVQDEVTHRIVEALAIRITTQEKHRLAQKATASLEAYDFFQEGKRLSRVSTKQTNEQARVAFRKAIQLDPNYGRAYGSIAYTLTFDYLRGWAENPNEALDRALVLAKKAVVLDDSTPQTYWVLGFAHLARKEYADAEKAAEESTRVAPNFADGYGLLALIDANLNKPKEAIALIKKGMRLNPYYTWEYLYIQGIAHYALGEYDDAIKVLEDAEKRNDNVAQIKLFLAASYVGAGRPGDAKWTVANLQTLSPTTTVTETANTIPIADPKLKQALLTDLRKAGLPE